MTNARVSQVVTEVLDVGTPNARVSQVVVEALDVGTPNARVSQVVVEPLVTKTPNARVSQVVVEPLIIGTPHARVSQCVVEVLCVHLERDVLPIYPELIGLGFNVKWKPAFFNMPTAKTSTGASIDLALASTPLHSFELNYDFLRDTRPFLPGSSEFKEMFGFFLRMGGTVGRFLFRNPDDNTVTGEFIATTDGTTSVFTPLTRTFGVGENVGTEPIGVMDFTRPYTFYLDGVKVDPALYQLLTDAPVAQSIKFFNTPTTGKKLTADYSYFYYCRFPDNEYTFEKFLDRIWLLGKINIESCRPGA